MTISDRNHDIISNLTKNLAATIMDMMAYASTFGVEMQPTEHFCAYSHPEDAEELIIRMRDGSVSIKVTMQDVDYAKDREDAEYSDGITEQIDDIISKILRRDR